MKMTNRILGTTLLIIIVGLIAMLIYLRFQLDESLARSDWKVSDSDCVSRTYRFQDFDQIYCEGSWRIDVEQADSFAVDIRAPEEAFGRIVINQNQERLEFQRKSDGALFEENIRVRILMPRLQSIRIYEGALIKFEDFDCEELTISATGPADISGKFNFIEDLNLTSQGAAHINLRKSRIRNAHLNVAGASAVELGMDGGRLSGSAAGAARITYYGTVSEQNIQGSGMVSIRHK